MDAIERIGQIVQESAIAFFMQGQLDKPMSAESAEAAALILECEVNLRVIDVTEDPEIRAFLPKFKGWPTFPQLFVNGELIGGLDIIKELHQQGELCLMLQNVSHNVLNTSMADYKDRPAARR